MTRSDRHAYRLDSHLPVPNERHLCRDEDAESGRSPRVETRLAFGVWRDVGVGNAAWSPQTGVRVRRFVLEAQSVCLIGPPGWASCSVDGTTRTLNCFSHLDLVYTFRGVLHTISTSREA